MGNPFNALRRLLGGGGEKKPKDKPQASKDGEGASSSQDAEQLAEQLQQQLSVGEPAPGRAVQPPEPGAAPAPGKLAVTPAPGKPGPAPVGIITDKCMMAHWASGHVEKPERMSDMIDLMVAQDITVRCKKLKARQATDQELLTGGHTKQHITQIDQLFAKCPGAYVNREPYEPKPAYCYVTPFTPKAPKAPGAPPSPDDDRPADEPDDPRQQVTAYDYCHGGDLFVSEGTATAARTAAGCVTELALAALKGSVTRGFAVVRPPGHHAECARAMGFCFFNNVAVAAKVALQQPGVSRVAVLDWDVHHGNGIQKMLLDDPNALYISLHRDTEYFYPYNGGTPKEVGEGPGAGFNVNVPWSRGGVGDRDAVAAFSLIIEPILMAYQPDIIIVAAGFDAADGDPLGGCHLSPLGYAWMTERLMRCAKQGRVVAALEGGYNTKMTAACACAVVNTMLSGSMPVPHQQAAPEQQAALRLGAEELLWWPWQGRGMTPKGLEDSLKETYEVHQAYWPVLAARPWADAWAAWQEVVKEGKPLPAP